GARTDHLVQEPRAVAGPAPQVDRPRHGSWGKLGQKGPRWLRVGLGEQVEPARRQFRIAERIVRSHKQPGLTLDLMASPVSNLFPPESQSAMTIAQHALVLTL